MSDGKKSAALTFNFLALIPALIRLVQSLGKGKTGAEKKAAVLDTLTTVIGAGVGAVATNNPKWGPVIGQIGDVIDETVAVMKQQKQIPDKSPDLPSAGDTPPVIGVPPTQPHPQPQPQPPSTAGSPNPMDAQYSTSTAAFVAKHQQNAAGGQQYTVIKRNDNGMFQLYPPNMLQYAPGAEVKEG